MKIILYVQISLWNYLDQGEIRDYIFLLIVIMCSIGGLPEPNPLSTSPFARHLNSAWPMSMVPDSIASRPAPKELERLEIAAHTACLAGNSLKAQLMAMVNCPNEHRATYVYSIILGPQLDCMQKCHRMCYFDGMFFLESLRMRGGKSRHCYRPLDRGFVSAQAYFFIYNQLTLLPNVMREYR